MARLAELWQKSDTRPLRVYGSYCNGSFDYIEFHLFSNDGYYMGLSNNRRAIKIHDFDYSDWELYEEPKCKYYALICIEGTEAMKLGEIRFISTNHAVTYDSKYWQRAPWLDEK